MSSEILPGIVATANVAVQVALRALTEVAPTLLDTSVPLTRRVALARTWVAFLCLTKQSWCPEDVPENSRDWDVASIEKVARHVIIFAHDILKTHLRTVSGRSRGV